MIDAKDIDLNSLKTSRRLICREALSRGWKVWLYSPDHGLDRLERPDGKVLEVFSATPPTTSYPAAIRANNKFLSFLNFSDHGVPVPATFLASRTQDATSAAMKLISEGKKAVIKPVDAAHGHGVSTTLDSQAAVEAAVDKARQWSDSLIIQEHLQDCLDLRLTCVNYEFTAGLIRVPARVKGDGNHTVKELIDIENSNPNRGHDYQKPLNVINVDEAAAFLGEKINTVPATGEYFGVLGTANVGTGGETIDITDVLPEWLMELAETAAKVAELPVCGVDFLVSAEPTKQADRQTLNPRLIEINVCPALFLHEQPTFGQPRNVISKYLDYLAVI